MRMTCGRNKTGTDGKARLARVQKQNWGLTTESSHRLGSSINSVPRSFPTNLPSPFFFFDNRRSAVLILFHSTTNTVTNTNKQHCTGLAGWRVCRPSSSFFVSLLQAGNLSIQQCRYVHASQPFIQSAYVLCFLACAQEERVDRLKGRQAGRQTGKQAGKGVCLTVCVTLDLTTSTDRPTDQPSSSL